MTQLLLGRDGQIGWELRRTLAPLGRVVAVGRSGAEPCADLGDFTRLASLVREVRPRVIINAAAFTGVDLAESRADEAFRINGEAAGILADLAREQGALLVHYSTDYVFSGEATRPYREDDPVCPANVYGRSKDAGEAVIRSSGAAHLILRTSWIYGGRGRNFLHTMLRLLGEREEIGVVDDQVGAPTWSRLVAEATSALLARALSPCARRRDVPQGTYHLSCAGQTSWYGFAAALREAALARGLATEPCARIRSIPTSAYPTPARRPAYSVLDNARLDRDFALTLPDWQDALGLCLDEMTQTIPALR